MHNWWNVFATSMPSMQLLVKSLGNDFIGVKLISPDCNSGVYYNSQSKVHSVKSYNSVYMCSIKYICLH